MGKGSDKDVHSPELQQQQQQQSLLLMQFRTTTLKTFGAKGDEYKHSSDSDLCDHQCSTIESQTFGHFFY
jgi:hypothetical protein